MKSRIFILASLVICLVASSTYANNKEAMKHHDQSRLEEKEVTLTGELIGLTCYVKHDSKGQKHKSCAKMCAEKGLPIGLLSDGLVYQISGEGHASLIDAYKPLMKYIESPIKVKGKSFEKSGLKMLVIDRIKKL